MLNYEYFCDPCDHQFEEHRRLEDRNRPAACPKCKALCRKVMSATRFNTVFVGSTRAEHLADKFTQMSLEAQAEGFRSQTEIEVAQEQAADRAAKMGTPGKQLIGPVESPLKGGVEKPKPKEAAIASILAQRVLKAASEGNRKKVEAAQEAVQHHEKELRVNASVKPVEFRPKNSKADHKDQIKASRDRRGRALT